MAIVRATVRWCKARLCTGFLFIVLCAVAWFAIFASYHSLHKDHSSNIDNDYEAGQLQSAAERRRLAEAYGDGEPAQRDNDDDDVQICKYPLLAAVETSDAWDAADEPQTCAPHPENLFYFDDGLLLTYDKALEGKRVSKCEFRGIDWSSDSHFVYTQLHVRRPPASFDVDIYHDFVHVQCYIGHRRGDQTTDSIQRKQRPNEALKEVQEDLDSRGRRRRDDREAEEVKDERKAERKMEKKIKDGVKGNNDSNVRPHFQFHDIKDFHRSVLHQNSPRLVGSLGLPDFRDNFLGQRTKADSQEPKNKESRHLLSETVAHGEDQEKDGDDHSPEEYPAEGKKQEEDNTMLQPTDLDQSPQPSFDQFLVQVSEKPEVLDRVTKDVLPLPSSLQMNVLLLAIDSVSSTSFKRNFQRSSQFLTEELKAVVMNGYNSLGDAATAAVIPLITGSREEEVRERRRSGHGGQYVDSLSFVWNKFEQSGYVTMFAEDQPRLGTFQTHYYGFEDIPVDHYMRPFWLAVSASNLDATSQPNCLGSVPKYQYTLEYLADFFRKYKSIPKFAFGFLSEFNQTRLVDDDLRSFLELLKKDGHLENTLLVILGDHGKSYGPLRNTIAGKLEESLPYLSLTFPSRFRAKYRRLMDNLRTNRNRLTTAFDVHETLMTLLDINSTQLPVNATSRAISLLQEVPRQRTCRNAEVDLHWCTCVKFEQINDLETIDKAGRKLASIAVQDINRLLDSEDKANQCARLSLHSVQDVRVVFANEVVLELENKLDGDRSEVFNLSHSYPLFARHHQVVFRTTPSDALFEATVVSSAPSYFSSSIINGQISRINAYGKQSDCIFKTHPDLRKYCQCTNA